MLDPNVVKYLPIVVLFVVTLCLASAIIMASLFLGPHNPSEAKLQQYECGFDPLCDVRNKFDIKFYLVAILFIIFDIEIIYLMPWAITLGFIGKFGFFSMMFFIFVLTVGFVYEWCKGALEW